MATDASAAHSSTPCSHDLGLTDAVLPISLVLATLSEQYVAGLTAFRHTSASGSAEGSGAVNAWLGTFVSAAEVAVEQSIQLMAEVAALRADWNERLTQHRRSMGLRESPRADSAVARLLTQLPEVPVVTASTLAGILDVSYPAASSAVDELRHAGILHPVPIERGTTAYVARDVLQLITEAERSLASTRFDTRISTPNRPVAARPEGAH